MMPVMGHAVLQSIVLLAKATQAFVDFCALEMEANIEACEASVEKSLSMVTSLNPLIGYEKAAALAKEAFKSGKTIRELCVEQKILEPEVLKKALDPWSMNRAASLSVAPRRTMFCKRIPGSSPWDFFASYAAIDSNRLLLNYVVRHSRYKPLHRLRSVSAPPVVFSKDGLLCLAFRRAACCHWPSAWVCWEPKPAWLNKTRHR